MVSRWPGGRAGCSLCAGGIRLPAGKLFFLEEALLANASVLTWSVMHFSSLRTSDLPKPPAPPYNHLSPQSNPCSRGKNRKEGFPPNLRRTWARKVALAQKANRCLCVWAGESVCSSHIGREDSETRSAVPWNGGLRWVFFHNKNKQSLAMDVSALHLSLEGLCMWKQQQQLMGALPGTKDFLGVGLQRQVPQEVRAGWGVRGMCNVVGLGQVMHQVSPGKPRNSLGTSKMGVCMVSAPT